MYYTTGGAYKKSKMIIDYANVLLTLCLIVLFVLILVMGTQYTVLFCMAFYVGTLMNGMCMVRHIMDKLKIKAVLRGIVMAALFMLGTMCLLTVI